jgi:hypothetical protein
MDTVKDEGVEKKVETRLQIARTMEGGREGCRGLNQKIFGKLLSGVNRFDLEQHPTPHFCSIEHTHSRNLPPSSSSKKPFTSSNYSYFSCTDLAFSKLIRNDFHFSHFDQTQTRQYYSMAGTNREKALRNPRKKTKKDKRA